MNNCTLEEKRIIERMKTEIRPFIQGILDGKATLSKSDYILFEIRWGVMTHMFKVIMGWPGSLASTDMKHSGIAAELFAYLGTAETLGNTIVDIVVMLVIANGRDFHIDCEYRTPRVRHVEKISDLYKVSLATKLNFLRDNGIKILPSMVDSKLRNDIAHLNFKFDPDTEEIFIRNKPADMVLHEGFKGLNMVFEIYDELHKLGKFFKNES